MLPELSHWFHLKGGDLDDMPDGEIEEYLSRLDELPKIPGLTRSWKFAGG